MPRIEEEAGPFASRDALYAWLQAGISAPSADNVHHVRFRITEEDGRPRTVELRATDTYEHCSETHRRRLMQLSFGAVAENLRLSLGAVYRTFDLRWFPEAADPTLLLSIDLRRLERVGAADPLARAIETRHTNRRLFRGPALSATEAATLAASVIDPGVTLRWFDEPAERRAILGLMRQAEALRFADRALHAELFESIDFTAGWHATSVEHLSPATLEIEAPLRGLFSALKHWPLMAAANRVGASRMLGLRAGDLPARLAPHVGVIASDGSGPDAALRAGAQFERLWLACEIGGFALQPMVASAILTTLGDGSAVRDRTRDALRAGWRALHGDREAFVVFRIGRAPRPRFVAARRPVKDYVT